MELGPLMIHSFLSPSHSSFQQNINEQSRASSFKDALQQIYSHQNSITNNHTLLYYNSTYKCMHLRRTLIILQARCKYESSTGPWLPSGNSASGMFFIHAKLLCPHGTKITCFPSSESGISIIKAGRFGPVVRYQELLGSKPQMVFPSLLQGQVKSLCVVSFANNKAVSGHGFLQTLLCFFPYEAHHVPLLTSHNK